jgi:hypothetical protein
LELTETPDWLATKRYPDNTGPDYAYTAAGRLATRTWARGNPRISTTDSYNDAGEQVNVNFSDSTPDVASTMDRRVRTRPSTETLFAPAGSSSTLPVYHTRPPPRKWRS